VKSYGTYVACVSYYSAAYGGWMLDYWYWTGSSFVFGTNIMIEAGTFGTAINIDANANNSLAVIYDNPTDNTLKMIAGNGSPFGWPVICTAAPVWLPHTDKKVYPDVSLHFGQSSTDPSGTYVHYTYTSLAGDEVAARYDKLYYICNNIPNTIYHFDYFMPPGTWAGFPRIAAPNKAGGLTDFAMVYNFVDPSSTLYEIKGVTGYNGNLYNHDYTDGSEGTCPLLGEYHKYPAVTYNNAWEGITVGWGTCWDQNLTEFIPCNVVAVQANLKGYVTNHYYYKTIPQFNLSNPRETAALSLSGRDGLYMLATFMDWTNTDVDYKDFKWNASSFRKADEVSEANSKMEIYPNPSVDNPVIRLDFDAAANAELTISDVTGRIIGTYQVTPGTKLINTSDLILNNGIYIARLVIDQQTQVCEKFSVLK